MRKRTLTLTAGAALAIAALTPVAPASATLDQPVKVVDSFDGTPCGVPVHVEIRGTNPVVTTGRLFDSGDPRMVNTGHLVQRLTTADGRWMEDDWSGPASRVDVWRTPDGDIHYRVAFDGIREEYRAWNGSAARDIGHLVVDYVFSADGTMLSRTGVTQRGDFPIATGQVTFCGFLTSALG